MEGLKISDAKLLVHIHPSKTNEVSDAITCELSSLLFKYNESFDGVLLAYEVVDIDSNNAKILSGLFPHIGVRLKANLLLFNPKPDMYLEGKVVKVTRESIHLVVVGIAAAVITEEDIRRDFKFKIKQGQEVFRSRSNKRHIIKVGTMIRFLVKSFNNEVIHISGSLAPDNTGSILWLRENRSPKRRIETGDATSDLVDGGALSVDSHVVKKPRKRSEESM